jgi:uncharacterized membrane protein
MARQGERRMILLILGLAIWSIAHLFPIVAHPARQRLAQAMGEGPWKGVFSLFVLAGLVLMIIGYQRAEYVEAYWPPEWGRHLNNLLMLFAVGLFAASHSKGNAKRYVRHPMLWSVIVWAVAHLLVNGDVASLILFGGLLVWAVVSIFTTNARDGAWVRPEPKPVKKDLILVAITLVAYGVIAFIHMQLGYPVFPG